MTDAFWFYLWPFGLSLALSLGLTPLVIGAAKRFGFVVQPREDRWSRRPTALMGGVGIFIAFAVSFWVFRPPGQMMIWLFICLAAMFTIGLIDDLVPFKPQIKFILQLLVAIGAVVAGIRIEIIKWPLVAIPLAIFWMVAITNAVNILDNMDGLAPGTAAIACIFLTIYAHIGLVPGVPIVSAALAGAVIGFLPYNFNPARIFMGDSGSLFLGFGLASLAIMGTWQNVTHLVLSMLVPVAVLVVPIFDTTLVSFERRRAGRSIAQGGRDHSSHRLVFLGLSERRAVAVLLFISLLAGLGALVLVTYTNVYTALTVLAIACVPLLFFGVFLSGIRVYGEKKKRRRSALSKVVFHKKQLLQISVDVVLLTAAYFAAYQLRFEGKTDTILRLFASSVPLVLAGKLVAFTVFGLYRGHWRYASINDLIRIVQAAVAGSVIALVLVILVFHFHGFSRAVFVIDLALTLLFVGGARVLIRVYKEYFDRLKTESGQEPVLIMGAGDGGELLLRELKNNDAFGFKVVGFIDDDPGKRGQIIHGVSVLGSREDLPGLVLKHGVKRVFISILSEPLGVFSRFIEDCRDIGVDCCRIQPILDLEATLRQSTGEEITQQKQ